MVAGKRRTPIGENADEPSRRDKRPHLIFGDVGEAEARKRCFHPQAQAGDHQRPIDTHLELAAVAFELPGIEFRRRSAGAG